MNTELLDHQIKLTNALTSKVKDDMAKTFLKGILELLISIDESIKENGVAVIMKGEGKD